MAQPAGFEPATPRLGMSGEKITDILSISIILYQSCIFHFKAYITFYENQPNLI